MMCLLTSDSVAALPAGNVYWHLDAYPNREAADSSRDARGTVVEAWGGTWLFTLADKEWKPRSGRHVATIGPLPVRARPAYVATYLEAALAPHTSGDFGEPLGPVAFHTEAGELCVETPRAAFTGEDFLPGPEPMRFSATSDTQWRGFLLILHDASSPPARVVKSWKARDLCFS
jgi:hypothetical protein